MLYLGLPIKNGWIFPWLFQWNGMDHTPKKPSCRTMRLISVMSPFTGLFTSCWTSLKNVGKTTLIYQKIPAIWIHLVHQKNTYLWWLRWLGENHENPRPPAAQAMNKAKHQGHGKEGRPRQGQPTWDENGFSLYEVYSLHDLKCDIQLEM